MNDFRERKKIEETVVLAIMIANLAYLDWYRQQSTKSGIAIFAFVSIRYVNVSRRGATSAYLANGYQTNETKENGEDAG